MAEWNKERAGLVQVGEGYRMVISPITVQEDFQDRVPDREDFLNPELMADRIPELMSQYDAEAKAWAQWKRQGWMPNTQEVEKLHVLINLISNGRRIAAFEGTLPMNISKAKAEAERALEKIQNRRYPSWMKKTAYKEPKMSSLMKKQSKYRWPRGTEDLVVHPEHILRRALYQNVITAQEYRDALEGRNDLLAELAYDEASWVGTEGDYGGHGFGSSDMRPLIKGLEKSYNQLKPKQASVTSSLKKDLIKLGSTSPQLRSDIKPILDAVTAGSRGKSASASFGSRYQEMFEDFLQDVLKQLPRNLDGFGTVKGQVQAHGVLSLAVEYYADVPSGDVVGRQAWLNVELTMADEANLQLKHTILSMVDTDTGKKMSKNRAWEGKKKVGFSANPMDISMRVADLLTSAG